MSLKDFSWNPNNRHFKKDAHALFGASNYHWINYSIIKMMDIKSSDKAKKLGTELHELAASLIKHRILLPDAEITLNMYVNDSIMLSLRPEQQLYFSEFFFGTADAIGIMEDTLYIHDLKTGKTPANMKQLYVYTAFFMLEYGLKPKNFKDIILRIYQSNKIVEEHPKNDIIVPIMDKILVADELLQKLKEEE